MSLNQELPFYLTYDSSTPKDEYYKELEYCRLHDIPIKLTRLKKEDGKEYLIVSKKVGIPETGK